MKVLQIRIDDVRHRKFKTECVKKGVSMKEGLEYLIDLFTTEIKKK